MRASASVALLILRTIEDHLLKGVSNHVIVKTRTNVALYILNQKRHNLFELESRFGVSITIEVDDSLEGGKHLEIERGEPLEQPIAPTQTVSMMMTDDLDDDLTEVEVEEDRERDEESSSKKRRRRRRRRKSNSDMQADAQNSSEDQSDDDSEANADGEEQSANGEEDGDDKPQKKAVVAAAGVVAATVAIAMVRMTCPLMMPMAKINRTLMQAHKTGMLTPAKQAKATPSL